MGQTGGTQQVHWHRAGARETTLITMIVDAPSAELLLEGLERLEKNIFISRMKRELQAAIEAACEGQESA